MSETTRRLLFVLRGVIDEIILIMRERGKEKNISKELYDASKLASFKVHWGESELSIKLTVRNTL